MYSPLLYTGATVSLIDTQQVVVEGNSGLLSPIFCVSLDSMQSRERDVVLLLNTVENTAGEQGHEVEPRFGSLNQAMI